VVVEAVPLEPVSTSKFPANREINREICRFGHFLGIFRSNQRADSTAYSQIPYATEQGIFGGLTGNFSEGTGNLMATTAIEVAGPKNVADDARAGYAGSG
jgi:hypothetical protein